MNFSYKICSFCKGVNHTEAYKLKGSNFSTIRVDIMNETGVPNPSTQKTATICNMCRDKTTDNPIQPLLDVMETAKVNDAEIAATINS